MDTPAADASPAPAIDAPFWDALEQGALRIPQCPACGQWTWPPQWRCGICGSWEMAWRDVPPTGIVHSLTWTRHPFTPAMVGRTPFPNLLVELPQAGGARLLGMSEGPGEGLAIGAAVEGVPGRDAEGLPVLRWRVRT